MEYESSDSNASSPLPDTDPLHPQQEQEKQLDGELSKHFKSEFTLPIEDPRDEKMKPTFQELMFARRFRSDPSVSSSPAPSSPDAQKASRSKGRKKNTLDLTGLVGGDSDSSALTQESGDEGAPTTPRDSVITGTDGGDDGEEEDAEMQEASPGSYSQQGLCQQLTTVPNQHPLPQPDRHEIERRQPKKLRHQRQRLRLRRVWAVQRNESAR